MPDQDEKQFQEELQRKAEELKRRTFEDESRRIARDAEERAQQTIKGRLNEDSQTYSRKLREAHDERQRRESALKSQEEEVQRKLRKEAEKKIEARARQEEERIRRKEEEQKRTEETEKARREQERRTAVEQERARRDEERRRIVESEKKKAEEARLQRDNEHRRKEQERRRKEEEVRTQAREREDRFRSLIVRAKMFYDEEDYEHASVEVAKALVNDPTNPEALDLERLIKEAQGKKVEEAEGADKPKKKERRPRAEAPPIAGKRKTYASALMIAAVFAILIVSILVIVELRKPPAISTISIAVLPWKSPSDDPEEKMIGSSLAEETASRLREYRSTVVMDFASSHRLADRTPDADLAAFDFGFRYAVQGTVARTTSGFSIGIRLVDSLRNLVWSHQFESPAESLAVVAGEIPRQIAVALAPGMAERTAGMTAVRVPVRREAYIPYLRALEMLHRCTPETTRSALLLLQEATRLDEGFAGALATAGSLISMRVERGWDENDSALSHAKQLADRAVALEPYSDDALRSLGNVLSQQGENRKALAALDTALRYSPKSGATLLSRAKVLLKVGKYQDAITTLGRAYSVSPSDYDLLQTFALAHLLAGSIHQGSVYQLNTIQYCEDSTAFLVGPFADAVVLDPDLSISQSDRVAAACRQRLRMQPGDYITMYRFARLLQVTGKPAQAGDLLGKAETFLRSELHGNPRNLQATMYLALTLTREGKFPEAVELALRASRAGKDNAEIKYMIAQMYALQMYSIREKRIDDKAKDEALKALREALAGMYRLDELASADFYNLFDRPEFRSAIQQAQ